MLTLGSGVTHKALYEGVLIDLPLAGFFLSKLLSRFNYVDDLPSLDPGAPPPPPPPQQSYAPPHPASPRCLCLQSCTGTSWCSSPTKATSRTSG